MCVFSVTTLRPQLGTVSYEDYRQITVADLPGLIEGAHANRGMGHRFLKHIERTKLLLFIVDIKGFQISPKYKHRSCIETILLLNKEIELYKPDLLERPAMLIINKMDKKNANEMYNDLKAKLTNLSDIVSEFDETMQPEKVLQFDDILTASLISRDKDKIQEIKVKIRNIIDKYEEKTLFPENTDSLENNLLEKLKQQSERYAPALV